LIRSRAAHDVGEYPGAPVEAWLYLYNRPTEGLARIAPGDCGVRDAA
jgi:hypothetical protein